MHRITNQMMNNTVIFNLNKQKFEMDKIQNSLATGKNVRVPRDNPIATTNQMLYRTRVTEINQYLTNIDESRSKLGEMDTALQSVISIFQRIRVNCTRG